VPCTHCSLPARRIAADASLAFCCSGCCLAHHLSVEGVSDSADRLLARVLLSAMLSMGVMMLSLSLYGSLLGEASDFDSESAIAMRGLLRLAALCISTPVMALLGLPLFETVLRMRRWLSADALIVLGTGAAFGVSVWNTFRGGGEVFFDTATMVLVLVSLGRWLDVSAKDKARAALELILPERDHGAVVVETGQESDVRIDEIRIGQIVRVRPGEVIPVDGVVYSGRSFVDSSDMTGEEEPCSFSAGDEVLAGTRLTDGTLDVRASAVGSDRVCEGMARILQSALSTPSSSVLLADRVAGRLIPIVLLLALGTAIWHWEALGAEGALLASLSVILIACPCSLGIATPLVFWAALGKAWKLGALVRGGDALEHLAQAKRIWLDKTGTLTDGTFELVRIQVHSGLSEAEALKIAASLELGSEHPIGRALRKAWNERSVENPLCSVEYFTNMPGVGVKGVIDGVQWSLQKGGVDGAVLLMCGTELQAGFELTSKARPEAREVIDALRAAGLKPTVLSGDAQGPVLRIADELGVSVEYGLLSADKVQRIMSQEPNAAIFVGDGLNDAAALAAASVGITVQGGSARAMNVADVNLLRPGLEVLPDLILLARRATRIARGNLLWAFGYNGLALLLAISGHLPPIAAAAAMVASSLAVVINSGRVLRAT
jgi:heavy metal translocating P-type ATPase